MNEHGRQTIGGSHARPPAPPARERSALALTFARAACVYWLAVFPRVCVHIARWRRRARLVPDPQLRRLVRASLAKRSNIEGAAAFAAFAARTRRGRAVQASCAFQAAYNLLDILGEQRCADPIADGRLLHEGLLYALNPPSCAPHTGAREAAPRDWYALHPLREDGGYLQSLLDECRAALGGLPGYPAVAGAVRVAAERIVAFQSYNLSEAQGDHAELERWARQATPPGSGLRWWETAAAAGSSLGVHVLIARCTHAPPPPESEIQALGEAYFPWIEALHSLLDNVVDSHEDAAAGHRSLLAYYDSPGQAAERLAWLMRRATEAAAGLPRGAEHLTILAGMVASYVSAPQARRPQAQPIAGAVLASAGPLTRAALLVFRLRRLLAPRERPPAHVRAAPPRIG